MRSNQRPSLAFIAGTVIVVCLILKGWDAIVGFIGIVLTAIIPLVLGACIAYVVSIPTNFLERHILPNSDYPGVVALRRPLSLAIAVVLVVSGIVLGSAVLVPAFVETVAMAQERGQDFIETVLGYPIMEPVRDSVHEFLNGDLMQSLANLDLTGIFQHALGGSIANFSNQLFTVVSTIMTGFFGMIFSFILLTDTTDVWTRTMEVAAEYLGPKRAERLALVLGVADASFHNFIVRQCIEACVLSTVAAGVLFLIGYEYALGVAVLMALAALVPIVGYPVGLLVGAFMVAISNPWWALLYIACVALAQMCEATLLLPHVGDPRTVLTPVWTTVGVTIGGGVAGFMGMLVAIPLAATIRQLVMIDVNRRTEARDQTGYAGDDDHAGEDTVQRGTHMAPEPSHESGDPDD